MINELLKAEGEELSRLLGEILQPEHEYLGSLQNCIHCHCNRNAMSSFGKCIRPIPLDDWNVAMKWRDWAFSDDHDEDCHYTFVTALEAIWRSGDMELCFEQWVIWKAQPRDYLQAAAELKLNQENNNG